MATIKQKRVAGIGAGIAAGLAAASAGYYFYASKDAKKHRQIVTKWAKDLKQEVTREIKRLPKIDRTKVASVVDEVAGAYATVRNLKPADLKVAAKELKSNWQSLRDEILPKSKKKVARKTKSKKTA